MLNVNEEIIESLGFDLEEAVQQFQVALEQHKFTVGVPAPTADPLVEEIVRAGGYAVIPKEPEEEAPDPEEPEVLEPAMVLAEMKAIVVRFEQLMALLPELEAKLE